MSEILSICPFGVFFLSLILWYLWLRGMGEVSIENRSRGRVIRGEGGGKRADQGQGGSLRERGRGGELLFGRPKF